jgi:hypothetical protein
MKTSQVPVICGVVLAAVLSAGASHWWSVRQLVAVFDSGLTPAPQSAPAMPAPSSPPALAANPSPSAPAEPDSPQTPRQKDFYEALIAKMARVETQNRDLLDHLAETNRDLMKLEFRVDTHSESFRPLPVGEDQPFSSLDMDIGVLPPRAEPVGLPSHE